MEQVLAVTAGRDAGLFGSGAWGVRVRAASRLSFTLIDLNGEGGRRNGMASLSLRRPAFQGVVRPNPSAGAIVPDDVFVPHREAIVRFISALAERWETPLPSVEIERPLPAHTGFGSKTTTLLALGKAYAELCQLRVPTHELCRIAGRGGTSGASVNLIDRGGFLVDGGHANPEDFDQDPQRYLVPSRFAAGAKPPPVLVSLPFPPWPILILIGVGTELSGKPELDWFRQTLPIPRAAAERTAHHVLLHLAPAVAEADYEAFCRALNILTYEHHYKQAQIAVQSEQIHQLFADARDEPGIDAACISVTGPMCYAFTRTPHKAVAWAERKREQGIVRDYFWSCAQNHPAVIEGIPA